MESYNSIVLFFDNLDVIVPDYYTYVNYYRHTTDYKVCVKIKTIINSLFGQINLYKDRSEKYFFMVLLLFYSYVPGVMRYLLDFNCSSMLILFYKELLITLSIDTMEFLETNLGITINRNSHNPKYRISIDSIFLCLIKTPVVDLLTKLDIVEFSNMDFPEHRKKFIWFYDMIVKAEYIKIMDEKQRLLDDACDQLSQTMATVV